MIIQLVKIDIKPFTEKKCKFGKTWLSKLGCRGSVNVDVHVIKRL